MPQGLPKYLSASFVRVGQNGIGHALLGPAEVTTTTNSGTSVTITCNTKYPFDPTLSYKITASAAFTLHLRVPSWYIPTSSYLTINNNGASYPLEPDAHTGMTPISLSAGTTTITLTLDAAIRAEPRGNSSVSIYHGALLYALDVGQTTTVLPANLYASSSYPPEDGPFTTPPEVHDVAFANTKPWNIAIDPSTLKFHTTASNTTGPSPLKNPIFDYGAPPTYITGKGCQIDWPLYNGIPEALPKLAQGKSRKCTGNQTDVVLRPYGSLKIHMAELPVVDLKSVNSTARVSRRFAQRVAGRRGANI